MIRQAAKGTGYDNEDARALLREAGVQAFRKQAGYVPMVDDTPKDKIPIGTVSFLRNWRKELFTSVHPVAVPRLAQAFTVFLKSHNEHHKVMPLVQSIVKQNRKFVEHEAA